MPSTRRNALRAAAGAVCASLAGCNALPGSGSSPTESREHGDPVPNYDTARHVAAGEKRLFHWTGRSDRSNEHALVATDEERSAVALDVGDDASVASFVAETDLSQSSIALFQKRHPACQRLDVFGLGKRPDELRVHLCQEPRPADQECQTEDRQSTLLAVRLPFDGESLSGLSVVESSRCESRFGPYRDGGES